MVTTEPIRKLQTLEADASRVEILDALDRDGACIINNAMEHKLLDEVLTQTRPWVERTPVGRDDFGGHQTQRTGALIARSPACAEVVMDTQILGLAREFLGPFCPKIQLHLTQIIRINPGAGKQPIHRDRLAWGNYMPRSIEPQINTLWALTDFTEENGATRVIPGSHRWPDERRAEPEEKIQAVMKRGSVLIYTGSVLHSGGENRSDMAREGMNITYCLSWLRQEENQYLSCPPDVAKRQSPQLQDLMGYTMGNYALGYFSWPDRIDAFDSMPPEYALGRKPEKRQQQVGG